MKQRYLLCIAAVLSASLQGQVSSNASLSGKYYVQYLSLYSDGKSYQTVYGSATFDGNGNIALTTQQLKGTSPAVPLTGSGTYSVKAGGFVTLALGSGTPVNARLTQGAIVGSTTEGANNQFDLFIAIPAPTQAVSNATLTGSYWVSSFELPGGTDTNLRNTNFKLTSTGAGLFNEKAVTGQARNLGNKLITQNVSPITYAVNADGTGTMTFPAAAGLDVNSQLIAGVKNIFVAQDGTYFIGGSTTAGIHGIVLGVKAFANNATSASLSGLYFFSGLRYDNPAGSTAARFTGTVGSVNAISTGAVLAQRLLQSDFPTAFDGSQLTNYSLTSDGSTSVAGGHLDAAAGGGVFSVSGVDVADASSYVIYFGGRVPAQSGASPFLNPLGLFNLASYAPPGYPVSPGGFVTLYGTFAAQTAQASALPFPPSLGGLTMTVNGKQAPLYAVSPTQLFAVVPNGVSGSTATFQVTVNGAKSNSIDVPLANTAPGVFSLPQNGLGDGAILHANFSVVNQASPATPGETVQVYLTGLGATNPAVTEGTAAPSKEPLARTVGPVNVYVGGILVPNIQFKGLAPALADLYQLNVQIPPNIGPGWQPLAIQTPEAFTDMVNIWVGSPN